MHLISKTETQMPASVNYVLEVIYISAVNVNGAPALIYFRP